MNITTIKDHIKSINNKFAEKVNVVRLNEYYKIYHESDFICYINSSITSLPSHINNFINITKTKTHLCIICITNTNEFIIHTIIKYISNMKKFHVILVGSNNDYLKYAIDYNANYIIAKNDYGTMIQTCLTLIKWSNLYHNNIFITNTNSIAHKNIIIKALDNTSMFITYPSIMKYIDLDNVLLYDIVFNNKISYWFIINKLLIKNIHDVINNKFTHNINYIKDDGTLCFTNNNKCNKALSCSNNEIDLLQLFTEYAPKIQTLINTINNKPESITIIKKDVLMHNDIKPITVHNVISNNKIVKKTLIDKYYICSTPITKLKVEHNLSSIPNKLILITTRFDSHVCALKDAIKYAHDCVAIIDENMICDPMFDIFSRHDIFNMNMYILLLKHGDNQQIKPFDMKYCQNISYIIDKKMFNVYLYLLLKIQDINTALCKIYDGNNIHIVNYFDINNVVIKRVYKTLEPVNIAARCIDFNPESESVVIKRGIRVKRKVSKCTGFNLEMEYGKYNDCCVILYWLPVNKGFIQEVDKLLTSFNKLDKFFVVKNDKGGNIDKIKHFINNDLYIHMFLLMRKCGLIKDIHIIFGMTSDDKYLYNGEPLISDGNYCKYDGVSIWKLNDAKSVLSFCNAKIFFYKGYGHYEHLYSMMSLMSPHSIFMRYMATTFQYVVVNDEIVIDTTWCTHYANNDKILCKNDYFKKVYTNYDLLFTDSIHNDKHYKMLFPNTKMFMKIDKYSLMKYEHCEREYDFIFCASDTHPSKNWDVLYEFFKYCDLNCLRLRVLIASPVTSSKSMEFDYKYVDIRFERSLNHEELNKLYCKCKCIFITFGRDAQPRVLMEALKCGCYGVVLEILTDGKDVIEKHAELGKIIKVPKQLRRYESSYKSIGCVLGKDQFDEIYSEVVKSRDHDKIHDVFVLHYDDVKIVGGIVDKVRKCIDAKRKFVVTIATENYSNNLNYLLSSLMHTNPSVGVIVYCVNWDDELLCQFRDVYENYYFREMWLDNFVKGDIIKLKVKLQYEVYKEYDSQYIWIDADSIVLKGLGRLFELLTKYNLVCYYRPSQPVHMKFAVAVIGFGKFDEGNDINEAFLRTYYDKCKVTEGYNGWFYDQSSLYETFVEYCDKIKLYELKEHEHSICDTIDTIVYSRRNDNKYELKELLKMSGIPLMHINFGGIRMVHH